MRNVTEDVNIFCSFILLAVRRALVQELKKERNFKEKTGNRRM